MCKGFGHEGAGMFREGRVLSCGERRNTRVSCGSSALLSLNPPISLMREVKCASPCYRQKVGAERGSNLLKAAH